MNIKVSIIILNYNGKKYNEDCLKSILNQSYKSFEIIFVDNASSDGSLEKVKKIFSKEIKLGKIKIIKNKENTGFTGGNNIGVKNSNATDYIWLLNNDTVADKDALKYLVEGIEGDKKTGAIGSLVLDKGLEEEIKNIFYKKKVKCATTFAGQSVTVNLTEKEYREKITNPYILGGCSFLYKKNIIKKPFPDFYFAYAEDNFLSSLILLKGYKLALNINSVIHHLGGSTKKNSKKINKLAIFHGTKNQIINFLIFYKASSTIKLFPLFLITQLGYTIFTKRFLYSIKSTLWCIININKIRKLRKNVQSQRKVKDKIFLKYFSYKFIEEGNGFSKNMNSIIKFINKIFKKYFDICLGKNYIENK